MDFLSHLGIQVFVVGYILALDECSYVLLGNDMCFGGCQ